jgi:HEAT repeat protein
VLGNVGTPDDAGVLTHMADEDPDPMLREHAAWALTRLRDAGDASR